MVNIQVFTIGSQNEVILRHSQKLQTNQIALKIMNLRGFNTFLRNAEEIKATFLSLHFCFKKPIFKKYTSTDNNILIPF